MAKHDYFVIVFILAVTITQNVQGSVNCIVCSQYQTQSCGRPFKHNDDRQHIRTCHSGVCKIVVYRQWVGSRDARLMRGCKEDYEVKLIGAYVPRERLYCTTEMCNADDDMLGGNETKHLFPVILILFCFTMMLFIQ